MDEKANTHTHTGLVFCRCSCCCCCYQRRPAKMHVSKSVPMSLSLAGHGLLSLFLTAPKPIKLASHSLTCEAMSIFRHICPWCLSMHHPREARRASGHERHASHLTPARKGKGWVKRSKICVCSCHMSLWPVPKCIFPIILNHVSICVWKMNTPLIMIMVQSLPYVWASASEDGKTHTCQWQSLDRHGQVQDPPV